MRCLFCYFKTDFPNCYCSSFTAHPCEYPSIPLNGNRTCYEDEEGVVCTFFCMDGYTFAIEPATQYTCAFDNKWEPADKLPVSDCSGNLVGCFIMNLFKKVSHFTSLTTYSVQAFEFE